MKRKIIILCCGIASLLQSCGKSNPIPTQNDTTTGATGSGTVPTDNDPVYQLLLARTNLTALNATHDNLTDLQFEIAGGDAQKYSTSGNVAIRCKNLSQANITYDNSIDYIEALYPSNAVPSAKGNTISIKDTDSYACLFITNPALQSIDKKQIIQVLFIYNDGSPGSGALTFQSGTKFKASELTADICNKLLTRNDLKGN